MANQGYSETKTSDKKLIGRLEYNIVPNDDLTSVITVDLFVITPVLVNIPSRTHTVSIGDNSYYINSAIVGNGKIHLGSVNKILTYQNNGAADSFRMGFNININGEIDGTSYTVIESGRPYYTPDPIPAPATITLSKQSYDIGGYMSIGISSPFKSTYTFDFNYTFCNSRGVILTGYTGVNGYWNIPEELAAEIPNSTSALCVIECITYDENGTKLGSTNVMTTLTVGDTFAPSMILSSEYQITHRTFEKGIGDIGQWNIGGYTICEQGATVANITATVNGVKARVWIDTSDVNKNEGVDFQIWGGGNYNNPGDSEIVFTVTDSRGLSKTDRITVTTLEYSKVKKTEVSVKRCNTDGTLNDEGDNALVTIKGSITPVYDNKYRVIIRYKKTKYGERDWTTITIDGDTDVNEIDITRIINDVVSIDSYDFEITMTDTIRNYTIDRIVTNLILDSNNVDIDFYGNGTGLAFGGMAKEIGLADFYLPIRAQRGFVAPELVTGVNFNTMITPGTYVNPQWNNETNKNSPDNNEDWQTILIVENTAVRKSKTGGVIYNRHITQTYIGVHQTSVVGDYTTHGYAVYMRNGWYDNNKVLWDSWYPVIKVGDTSYRVLWSGAYYMNESQSITLAEKISQQPNGIALVFSSYNSETKTANDFDFQDFFVSKQAVALQNGKGHQFTMSAGNFSRMARKYLYISDTRITGNANNTASGTGSGITYANNHFVLRYVIGL